MFTLKTRIRHLLAGITTLVTVFAVANIGIPNAVSLPNMTDWTRIGGADRYETSFKTVQKIDPHPSRIYLASGLSYADALSASAFKDGPTMLVHPQKPYEAHLRVQALGSPHVTILGSTGALPATYNHVFPGARRIGGVDRFETSFKILQAAPPINHRVILASGLGFADALSAGSAKPESVMLAHPRRLAETKARLQALGVKVFWILGGPGVLPATYDRAFPEAHRLAGPDRFETSRQVMNNSWYGDRAKHIYIASGLGFADALSAAAFQDGPILLVNPRQPARTLKAVTKTGNPGIIMLGGSNVLPDPRPATPPQPTTPTNNTPNTGKADPNMPNTPPAGYWPGTSPEYPHGKYWKPGLQTQWNEGTPLVYSDPQLARLYDLRAIDDEFVRLLNEHRVSIGLQPLVRDPELDALAQWNQDEVNSGRREQKRLAEGVDPRDLAATFHASYQEMSDFFGCSNCVVAEVADLGSSSIDYTGWEGPGTPQYVQAKRLDVAQHALDKLLASPPHKAILEYPDGQTVGVAFHLASDCSHTMFAEIS